MSKRNSRTVLIAISAAAVVGAITYAYWPRPLLVDIAEVTVANMVVTIDEDARTRVHSTYVVSTPIAGRLLRLDVEPGTDVKQGETVVARMLPINPAVLDARTREQAKAAVDAANAGLRVARANFESALADQDLAEANLSRMEILNQSGTVSRAALDQAKREARAATAAGDTARAAISMRVAELTNAQTQMIRFDDRGIADAISSSAAQEKIDIHAPATGTVLRLIQQSETTLPAGAPIMEIGNIEQELEVVADLLSSDAVKVAVGDRVIIDNWGGEAPLDGTISRVDPWGFTKISALGVEEQRVTVNVQINGSPEQRASLGHGFRVRVRIVTWEDDQAIVVPSSSLFRVNGEWAVFAVEEGVATQRMVATDQNNGQLANVTQGLAPGDNIVRYPASGLASGNSVRQRATE